MKTKSKVRNLIKQLEKQLEKQPQNEALFDRIQHLREKYEVHKYHDNEGLNEIDKKISALQSKIAYTLKKIQQEYAFKKGLLNKNVNVNDSEYLYCLHCISELHKQQFNNKSKLRKLYEERNNYVFYHHIQK